MAGKWKTEENQTQVSLRFPPALGNRGGDSHILHSAAPDCPLYKNTKRKPQKGARASRSPDFHSFRLILRLENAGGPNGLRKTAKAGE